MPPHAHRLLVATASLVACLTLVRARDHEVRLGEGSVGHHLIVGEQGAHLRQEGFAAYRWLIWPLVLIHVVALVSWMLFLCRVSSKEEERLKAKHKKAPPEWGLTVMERLGLAKPKGVPNHGHRKDTPSISLASLMDPVASISVAPMAASGKDR